MYKKYIFIIISLLKNYSSRDTIPLNERILELSLFGPVLRIRDVYPGFQILIFTHPGSRISDLGSLIQKQEQKRGAKKKLVVKPFYVATNFTKM
jgi:hypothetical protein